MRRYRNAKIIATLGPSSSTPEAIAALYEAGADVFRLNFSHGSHEDHRNSLNTIRELEQKYNRPIGILLDLQGPKFRVGTFAEGAVELTPGDKFRLDSEEQEGNKNRIHLPHPEILKALQAGDELLLNDGNIRLRVSQSGEDFVETEVEVGGKLSNHKGVNVPGVIIPLSPITAKDREDLRFGLELGVDWVAMSFVQSPEDLRELRGLVGDRAKIMTKLEKPSAVKRLEEIVELSDAVMVARGDLGVELPPERVPSIQKRVLRTCRRAGKPVVVATQMLESMINAPTPTRAEASDVATAVYDGADAVMLSAETAAGKYPVEAVTMMDNIIKNVEDDPEQLKMLDAAHPTADENVPDAICAALRTVTHILPIVATVTYTNTGSTSLRAARERPHAPILSLTPHIETARRLTLVWGVYSARTNVLTSVSGVIGDASEMALSHKFAKHGDMLAITAGMPFGVSGTTNFLRIATID